MKYHVARESETLGEFSDLDISAGLRSGQFRHADLCWAHGMADWEPLFQRFELTEPETPAGTPPPLPAMLSLDRLPNLAVEMGLATRLQRLGAWLVDSISLLPVFMLVARGLGDKVVNTEDPNVLMEALMEEMKARPEAFQPAAWAFLALMLTNVVLLSLRGQSIGKWITGIRIVMFQTGERAGFVRAVLLRSVVMGVLGSIAYIGFGLQLFDILCIFRADHRCLHDLIADTMVVRAGRG